MMIARWHVQARFGHRQAAVELMKRWWRDIAPGIGWSREQVRILTGAVGERDSTIDVEVGVAGLAARSEAWTRLAETKEQEEWARELEPHIVSGTPGWTVHRVV